MVSPSKFDPFNLDKFFTSPVAIHKPIKLDHQLLEEIRGVNAEEIELIAIAIIDQILLNLGSDAKLRIEIQLMQKIEPEANHSEIVKYFMLTKLGKLSQKERGNSPFPSSQESKRFIDELLWPLRKTITTVFSNPLNFLYWGLHLHLSNYIPTGTLEAAAKKAGIEINSFQIPLNYHMVLRLNRELSEQRPELVFSLIQTSERIEFSKQNFTTEELKQSFVSFF